MKLSVSIISLASFTFPFEVVSGCTDRSGSWTIGRRTKPWCFKAGKVQSETQRKCAEKNLYIDCPVTCNSCPTAVPSVEPSTSFEASTGPSVEPSTSVQPSTAPSVKRPDILWGLGPKILQIRLSIFCDPLVVTRLDPIASPGESCSDHVHVVYGNKFFNSKISMSDIQQNHTTCAGNNDFSSYWAPSLYHQDENNIFHLVPLRKNTVYYKTPKNDEPGKQFKPNFRMKGGNHLLDPTNPVIGQDEVSYVEYKCSKPRGLYKSSSSYLDFGNDCELLFIKVRFPDCIKDYNDLDGVTTGNYAHSHIKTGVCPTSHPVKLIILELNIFYDIKGLKVTDLVLSNGDKTGKSMHGDFVSGWPMGTLSEAVEKCKFGPGRFHGFECPEGDEKNAITGKMSPPFNGWHYGHYNDTFPVEEVDGVSELPRGTGNC